MVVIRNAHLDTRAAALQSMRVEAIAASRRRNPAFHLNPGGYEVAQVVQSDKRCVWIRAFSEIGDVHIRDPHACRSRTPFNEHTVARFYLVSPAVHRKVVAARGNLG